MSEKSKIGKYVSLQLTGRIKRKVNHVLNVAFCREMKKIINDKKVKEAFEGKAIEIINKTKLRHDLATSLKKLRPNFNSTNRTRKLDWLKDGIKKGLSKAANKYNQSETRKNMNASLNQLRKKVGLSEKELGMIDDNFDNMQDRRRRIMKTAKNKRIKRTKEAAAPFKTQLTQKTRDRLTELGGVNISDEDLLTLKEELGDVEYKKVIGRLEYEKSAKKYNENMKKKQRFWGFNEHDRIGDPTAQPVKNKNINFDELAYQQEMERRRGNVNQTGGVNMTEAMQNPLAAMSNLFTFDFNPDTLVEIVDKQINLANVKISKAVNSEKITRIIRNSFMELLKHRVFNRQKFRKRLLYVLENNTRNMVTKEGVYKTQFLYKASQANCQRAPTIVP